MAKNLLPALGLVGAIAFIPAATASMAQVDAGSVREISQFMTVFERVKAEYVDQVTDEQLVRGAIDGMLASLDPHSSYLDARGFRTLMTTTDGNYGGLGLTVTMDDSAVKVIAATRGTPADRAGIKAGDFITHIDGRLFYGGTLDEAVDRMRGNPGTSVRITIARPGRDRPFDVTITRAIIDIPAVRSEVRDGVGIITVTTFSRVTTEFGRPRHGRYRAPARPPAARLCARPALQSGRAARPGGRPFRPVPRARRDRLAARPPPHRHRALLCPAGRRRPRRAGDRAGRRRHGLGVRDRRGGAAGPSPRDRHGRAHLRQGLGPDPAPARRRKHRAAPHHGALLHAVGPLGAGGRDHARRAGAAALRPRLPACATGSANRTCAAISSTRPASATS